MNKLSFLVISSFSLIFANAQNIYTIAGNGTQGYSGDGSAATLAQLKNPTRVAIDASGNIYIAENGNQRIRKINAAGIISTFAGNGTAGYSGDGGLATLAQINNPEAIAVDASGNVYIGDLGNFSVRKINSSGIISTVAGNGTAGFSGDGTTATLAQLKGPYGLAVDGAGNLYIGDAGNNRIRKVSPSGIISTVAGNGNPGFSGDGAAATLAQLNGPSGIAIDGSGNIFIADEANNRIRMINSSGIISTVAGSGVSGYGGEGSSATNAKLQYPEGVAVDATGNIYIADLGNIVIRKVDVGGIISTYAGTGVSGYSGDGGPAANARLSNPDGVSIDASGNLYISDTFNNVIRKVCNNVCTLSVPTLAGKQDNVLIYPNPSSGAFTLQIDKEIKMAQ